MVARLKAFTVFDGEESSVVVFATNHAAARRLGAGMLGTEFEAVESCRRIPEFDTYSPGPVPPLALIAAGWWFECAGCWRRVSDEGDDEVGVAVMVPVVVGQDVYCCDGCRKRHQAAVARERQVAAETLEAMIGAVIARYPHATFREQYVNVRPAAEDGWPEVTFARVTFDFPGSRHGGAEVRYELRSSGAARSLHVAHADLEAISP